MGWSLFSYGEKPQAAKELMKLFIACGRSFWCPELVRHGVLYRQIQQDTCETKCWSRCEYSLKLNSDFIYFQKNSLRHHYSHLKDFFFFLRPVSTLYLFPSISLEDVHINGTGVLSIWTLLQPSRPLRVTSWPMSLEITIVFDSLEHWWILQVKIKQNKKRIWFCLLTDLWTKSANLSKS